MIECIQGQINQIKNTIKDRQSLLAWQAVDNVSGKKSPPKSNLKAASIKNGKNI